MGVLTAPEGISKEDPAMLPGITFPWKFSL